MLRIHVVKLPFDEMIKEAGELPPVPLRSATAYQENSAVLIQFVDDTLSAEPSIHDLIGNNPMQMMYDNHRHHAAFMATVFSIGNYELLAKTVPWVYRAYAARNFSYDYFSLELRTWLLALEKTIDPNMTKEIKSIYSWLLSRHENMICLSQTEAESSLAIGENWLVIKNSFQSALLEGNHSKCLAIATESVKTAKDVEPFYLQIIQPVMYEIGMLWERGTISVAQEHLASAIVGRIMAKTHTLPIDSRQTKGKAVVTAAPNEFHEIGAWMISDILEHDGWEVKYLGANTPASDLLELLRDFQPDVLALSVTIPFNIANAKDIISAVKTSKELNRVRVMVGGRPFNETSGLWRLTGADGFAANARDAKQLAHGWQNNEGL
jgi:methanogenic corrinoid protein MtbC1